MFEEESDEEEAIMNWLEEEGAIVWSGMSIDGERTMSVNPEKLKEIFPEMYDAMMEDLSEGITVLHSMGYVDITLDEDGEELYAISDEGMKLMDKFGFNLKDAVQDEDC